MVLGASTLVVDPTHIDRPSCARSARSANGLRGPATDNRFSQPMPAGAERAQGGRP